MASAEQTDQRDRLAGGLRPGPVIVGHRIQSDDRQHAWVIDDTLIACTPTAFACLKLLLERAEQCVPFARLIAQFPEAPIDPRLQRQARLKLTHLMSDLRAKLWPLGLEIASVVNVGYVLLCRREETPADSLHPSQK